MAVRKKDLLQFVSRAYGPNTVRACESMLKGYSSDDLVSTPYAVIQQAQYHRHADAITGARRNGTTPFDSRPVPLEVDESH